MMGRLVGGAIQAVVNAGYEVSKEQTVAIADKLFDENPPSGNDRQEYQAIRDGIRAGKESPTRIRRLVTTVVREVNGKSVECSLINKVREYYSGTHALLDVNEMKLARLFVHLYSDSFKYSGDSKCWYEWNGRVWNQSEIKDKNKAMSLVQSMLDVLIDYASDIPDDKERMKYMALVSAHMTSARISGIVTLAQTASESYFDIYQYENYSYFFPVANGEIDMKTGKLIPSNKNHGFTRCSTHTYSEDADCPEFKKFLNTIFLGRQELIDYVQAAMGYSLMGDSGYQVLFYCYGDGRNGKSTLFEIMSKIAGEWHKETITDTILLHRSSNGSDLKSYIAQLKDVRVTTVPEIPENTQLDYALIKRITGGEKLSARAPHQAPVEFRPTHTLWLSGNKLPPMKQHDKGIWRRFKIIPFEYEYPESVEMNMNAVMDMYYKDEMSGILRWMIEGAIRLLKDNKFPRCSIVDAKTQEFKATQDIYELFLEECCDVSKVNEESYWTHKKLAWAVFNRWSDDSKVQIHKDKYKLTANIVDRLRFKVGKKGGEFYLGFRIKPEYLKSIYDMDIEKMNAFGLKDLDDEEPSRGFKSNIVQMPARNLPIQLDDVADDTF
jgi:P4 family phage/plasmid primase-like protien